MKIEKYIIDKIVQQLEEAETQLSDEAYEFLASHENIDDIMVYQKALIDYLKVLNYRFFSDEEDEQDELVIKRMLNLINVLVNAMIDLNKEP